LRVRTALALFVASSLTTACALFPSFDGFTDGGGPEAGTDSGGAGDAKGKGWCASQGPHLLCDDFDEPDAGVVGPWNMEQVNGDGGTLSLSDATSVSAPSSLLAEMQPTSISAAFVRLQQTYVPVAKSSMTYAFDFLTAQQGLSGGTVLANATISLANGEIYALDLRLEGTVLQIYEQQGQTENPYVLTNSAQIGAWVRISIQVTSLGSSSPMLTVQYGLADAGALPTVLQTNIPGIVGTVPTSGPAPLLGLAYLDIPTNGPLDCYFDNVTFDYE
jgi:hypothetical protein